MKPKRDAQLIETVGRTVCANAALAPCATLCNLCHQEAVDIITKLRESGAVVMMPGSPEYESTLAAMANAYVKFNPEGPRFVSLQQFDAAVRAAADLGKLHSNLK